MKAEIRLNRVVNAHLLAKMPTAHRRALTLVSMEALRDIGPYVPFLEGTLSGSTTASRFEEGQLVWWTEYARYQYYDGPNKTTTPHAQATMMWAEVAASEHGDAWRKKLGRDYHRALKGR